MELSDFAVFVKVVQAGSFTQAARLLAAPKSTVSSKVAALERRLGVTLLQRTTRKLHLTEEGEGFFRTCAQALSDIEAAEAVAAQGQKTPTGRIAVTAPADSGRFLPQFLKNFLTRYPGISVDLILTNRYVDLIGEGVDVALRAGELSDSTLMAKRVAMNHRCLFASPAYLKKYGTPSQPSDLMQHECVRFNSQRGDEWKLVNEKRTVTVKASGKLTVDDLSALKALVLHDHGIGLIPTFFCKEDVAAKRLVPVLPQWRTESTPICVVYPAQKFQHPKVRVFVDEIAAAMQAMYGEGKPW